MPFKQTDLITRILNDLNVVGLGQAPQAEVQADMVARTTSIVNDLNARRIAYLPDIDQIDDGVFESLVTLLNAVIGPGYGRAAVDVLTIERLEDKIKSASRPTAARRTLSVDPMLRQGGRGMAGRFNGVTG